MMLWNAFPASPYCLSCFFFFLKKKSLLHHPVTLITHSFEEKEGGGGGGGQRKKSPQLYLRRKSDSDQDVISFLSSLCRADSSYLLPFLSFFFFSFVWEKKSLPPHARFTTGPITSFENRKGGLGLYSFIPTPSYIFLLSFSFFLSCAPYIAIGFGETSHSSLDLRVADWFGLVWFAWVCIGFVLGCLICVRGVSSSG